jgi:hypothetical protein
MGTQRNRPRAHRRYRHRRPGRQGWGRPASSPIGDLVEIFLEAITDWPGVVGSHNAVKAIRTAAARHGKTTLVEQADAWLASHPLYSRQLQITGSGLDPGELITIDVDGRNIGLVNADRHGRVNTTITTPPQPFPPRQARRWARQAA